jgi:hypothetical protein
MDCEGCWHIGRNRKWVIFTFKLSSQDKLILEQIRDKLIDEDFRVYFSLSMKRGIKSSKWKLNRDFYSLVIYRKMDVIRLAEKLLPLSNHTEKIWKIRLILTNRNKNWNEIEKKLSIIKRKIKEQTFR